MVILSEELTYPILFRKINFKIHQIVPTQLLTKIHSKEEHKNLTVTRITKKIVTEEFPQNERIGKIH